MKHLIFTKSLMVLVLLLGFTGLQAQFTINGTVVDDANQPLIGVSVVVKGTVIGTSTDLDGKYSIEVPGESGTLVFSYIGYEARETPVTKAGSRINNVTMSEGVSTLDEVIVSGLATTVKRSNLANSVASISAAELTGVTTQSTMDGALYGKFKGAEIKSNSGAPGGGMSVKLRGVTSIFGNQQPLYIVDGVFIDNRTISTGTNVVSAAAGGGNAATNQDDASNRIADIDPEDIENIEILKGASAAAIYGSRAAGGVVIITTKRGKAGKARVSIGQTLGMTQAIRLLGQRSWDEAKIRSTYFPSDPDGADADAEVQRFKDNGVTDYENELYGNNGLLSTSRLTISGGNDKSNYFIGGTFKNDNGIVDNTGYQKASVRANIGHTFTDWLKLDISNNYINSTADRGFFNNSNTNTTIGYAMAFTRPWDDLFPDATGVYPGNPNVGSNVLETVALITNREKVNRYIGGGTLTARLFSNDNNNLKLILRGGLDQYNLRTTGIFPQQLSFFRVPGTLEGASIVGSSVSTNTNMAGILVHSFYTESNLSFTTQFGLTQEDANLNTVISTATRLNGSQTNLDQSGTRDIEQNRQIRKDKGFFVQEEVNFQDKVIATLGVRGDKSSNNGDVNKLYFYPKANLALNLHEFDFLSSEALSQVKLRVAYGQSGRVPPFGRKYNGYDGTVIAGQSGLISSTLRGNPEVGPERQAELEFGADLGFLNNKILLDVSFYTKTITDLLLEAGLPTSTGYIDEVINGGSLRNDGIELGLRATPVTGDFTWTTITNFWKNKSEVTSLDVPAFNEGGFAASLGQYRIQEGRSATQIVGTYNPDDCETGDCSDLDPDGDGFRVYGDAEADFNMSFTNNFNYKGVELGIVMHWKQGGDAVNLSTLLYDLAGTTWDYDDTTLDPAGQMGNGTYRTSEWFSGNAGPWIEDASYFRVREIGLFYTLPNLIMDAAKVKFGLSGRNLINVFDYNSYDPEVSNFGGNVLANSIEVTPFPSSKSFNFHLNVTF